MNIDQILELAEVAPVFPIRANAKTPLIKRWQDRATKDRKTIEQWAKRWPDANWGWACGHAMPDSGFFAVVDLDRKNGVDGVIAWQAIEAKHGAIASPVCSTPSGGEHRYLLTRKPVANSAGRIAQGIDSRGLGGYVLTPGSVIDGKPYALTSKRAPQFAPAWLEELLSGPPERATRAAETTVEPTVAPSASERARRHLASLAVVREGSRNDEVFRAAAVCKDFGLSEPDCLALMAEEFKCEPALDADELQRTVASAYARPGLGSESPENDFEKVAGTQAKRPRFPRVKLSEITAASRTNYLIKGVLDRGTLALVYGAPGSGKTFFTIDIACHIGAGRPWRGKRTKRGLVVYVAAEAGQSILRRFAAWRDKHGAEADIHIVTRGANLLHDADVRALMAELQAIAAEAGQQPDVVVFDTVSRSIAGADENSASDISKLVGVADSIRDQFGAATIAVHHSGKDSTKGARGSSALGAAADTTIRVADCTAILERARDGRDGEQLPFDLETVTVWTDEDGDPVTTCLVKHLGDIPPERRPQPKLSTAEVIAMRALRTATKKHGKAAAGRDGIPAHARTVTIDQWREQFQNDYGTDSHTPSSASRAFRRARLRLAEVGLVGVAGRAAWATADDAQQPTETPASPEEIFS